MGYAGGVRSSGTSPKLSYWPAKPVDFFGSMINIAQTAVATSAGLSDPMRLHPRREVANCGAPRQNSDPSPFGISDWGARWTSSPGRRTVRSRSRFSKTPGIADFPVVLPRSFRSHQIRGQKCRDGVAFPGFLLVFRACSRREPLGLAHPLVKSISAVYHGADPASRSPVYGLSALDPNPDETLP